MKSKIYLVYIILCTILFLAACQNSANPAPEDSTPEVTGSEGLASAASVLGEEPEAPAPDRSRSQRDREWIEDIEFLREKYKTTHMDPFYLCTEEEFDFRLDQLEAKVSELSDTDIYYELMAVLARMEDNHTYVRSSPSDTVYDELYSRRFPISARYINEKLYLDGYLEGCEQFAPYLLREIVAVNGIDISYLSQKVEEITHVYNSWFARELFRQVYFLPAFFDWAGCDYREGYTFQILNENQEVEDIEVPVLAPEDYRGVWAVPENWDKLYYSRYGDWAEYIEGENGGCIYMHFVTQTNVPALIANFDATTALVEEHPECGKLVIDLRDHPGGFLERAELVRDYAKKLAASSVEQTYVLTGGFTASAAIDCIGVFRDVLDAVVVGEPTAQFASFFVKNRVEGGFVLPNSQIACQVSTGWYETALEHDAYYDEDGRLYEWENTVPPDVYVHQDIDDIRQGKDSVLQWALAQ